jgi:hypothetical protein
VFEQERAALGAWPCVFIDRCAERRTVAVAEPGYDVRCQPRPKVHQHTLDGCFAGADDTDLVYQSACRELVADAANGGAATVLLYGQTGSGKTHTTLGFVPRASRDLFADLAAAGRDVVPASSLGADEHPDRSVAIGLTCVEVLGDNVTCLLSRETVSVLEDQSCTVRLRGAAESFVSTAAELTRAIEAALASRTTKATGRNDTSSRSHAVVRVRIAFLGNDDRAAGREDGELFLVDLAGSERNADQLTHDKERLVETKAINLSLMTLKDCIKARGLVSAGATDKHIHIPYRRSKLTVGWLRNVFL